MPLHQTQINQKTRAQSHCLVDIHPYQAVQSTKTQNYAQTNEPPGGTCIPAKRFLGKT